MKRSTKWLIVIAVLAVFFGQYGHILYSWIGLDTDGYTADMKGKKIAYKLHGAYKQAEVDSCFEKIGIDPDDLDDLLGKIKSGAITASPTLKKCIEKKAEGYASPKRDLGNALTGLKKIVAGKPRSQLCGQLTYTPKQWVGGTKISAPSNCKIPYTIEVSGTYFQIFSDGPTEIKARHGKKIKPMLPNEWAIMPIQNLSMYGVCLIDGVPNNKNLRYFRRHIHVNVNVSQAYYGYKDLKGTIFLNFYD